MFVLSPSVVTTIASASSIPASRRRVRSIPWPTVKPPVQASPSRPRASSFSSTTVTSQPDPSSWSATDEPTRPQPITIAFTAAQRTPWRAGAASSDRRQLLVHHGLREGDDQHLARGLAEDVVDRRREEPRLAPPARSRAEDDQIGVDLECVLDDRGADRARSDRRPLDRHAVVDAE